MTFEEKLANQEYDRIWQEYCGFLDLDMESYMRIQRRLLEEQIRLWSSSPLGQKILKGRTPSNVEEFRSMVPLTTYEDYADVLLLKRRTCFRISPSYGFRPPGRGANTLLRWLPTPMPCWRLIRITLSPAL